MSHDSDTPETAPDSVYNDPNADFTLISSENVAFKLYRHHLALSSVFMDLMRSAPAPDPEICLVDTQMEDSHTIRYVLDYLHNRQPPLNWDNLEYFRNTIAFVKKYDMSLIEPSLVISLQRYLENGGSEQYCFILAAELDDPSIAAIAIQKGESEAFSNDDHTSPSRWFNQSQMDEQRRLSGSHTHDRWEFIDEILDLNPAAWPIWELRPVHFEYLAALSRTQLKFPSNRKRSKRQAAADYFKQLMEDLKA